MPEFFEICNLYKKSYTERKTDDGYGYDDEMRKAVIGVKTKVLNLTDALFEMFDSKNEIVERTISIPNLKITNDNFNDVIADIAGIAETCMNLDDENYIVSTGVYEWTYNYIEKVETVDDIDAMILKKFPLVFVGKSSKHKWNLNFYQVSDVMLYAFHDDAQRIK